MTLDSDGSSIIVGEFDNSITLGLGDNETTLTGTGAEGYVAKYAGDGSADLCDLNAVCKAVSIAVVYAGGKNLCLSFQSSEGLTVGA